MDAFKLPSYEEIFGSLDFQEGNDARSVLSPAAYLTDLLQLLDDKLQGASFHQRRPDIKGLPLNKDNTYTSIPYLDIVNGILEGEVGNAYTALRDAKYPFNFPFNFENERIKKFLHYLNITSEALYKTFSLESNFQELSNDYLKLSVEECEAITQVAESATLKTYFGEITNSKKFDVSRFLSITGLSDQELREILYQNLSATAIDPGATPGSATTGKHQLTTERTKATDFFINSSALEGYVALDEQEENLIWISVSGQSGHSSIPESWFDQVTRLIRLNRKTGLSFADLDLILRSCCSKKLDKAAIHKIAVIKQMCDRYELAVDVVCSFFSDINILGISDTPEPQDLFNRVFNAKLVNLDNKYIKASSFVPTPYADCEVLICSDDLLSSNQKDYRKRVCQALDISDGELAFIVNKVREQSKISGNGASVLDGKQAMGLSALSLLFRITQLCKLLELSCEDLFNLFDILGKDPTIRTQSNFSLLIHYVTEEQDCYKIIAGGGKDHVQASMWLVQTLCAIASWMQTHDFTTEELKQWLMGAYKDSLTAEANKTQKISFLNNLYQQIKPVIFSADIFESEALDSRAARVIYETFTAQHSGLVASSDKRLVKYDTALAEKTSYQALNNFGRISREDFTELGLEQKMLDKLFSNLIIKGYITTEGQLLEKNFPATVDGFQLETDFSSYEEAVFTTIYNLLMEVMDVNEDEETEDSLSIELAIYPSDLEELEGLSVSDRDELYDNLIFNGYLDEEGNILQPDFFTAEENVDYFDISIDFSTHTASIFKLILEQTQRFNQEALVLERDVFAELPLKPFEIDELIENLKFNGYIDSKQIIINKKAFLSETPQTFNLALNFYPHRRQILKAIQNLIHEFKSGFYTFSKDAFTDIASNIVAQWVYKQLEDDYLQNGVLEGEQELFFLDSDNLEQFSLDPYFSENDTEIVFSTIQSIVIASKKYQFTTELLEELDFSIDEQEELISLLEETGYLYDRTKLPWDKVSYFLTIDNALQFTLANFEDYNKDIFFALHGVAKAIDADVQEITTTFKVLAETQEAVLLEVLQDHFGVDADIIHTICRHVFQGSTSIVEEFLVPVLSTVDRYDVITAEPNHSKFNFAYRRIGQFAAIAAKLNLDAIETAIAWQDQDLAEKFPEKLVLPPGIDRFDALLGNGQGTLYLFKDNYYWAYSATNYNLLTPEKAPLTTLSPEFSAITKVDAAFADSTGNLWLIAQNTLYVKTKGSDRWTKQERKWGKVSTNFKELERVDATFQDKDNKTYLFSGDQYIRYSSNNYSFVDEGYPLKIENNWVQDALSGEVPKSFQKSIDASFQDINGKTYLFKSGEYICLESSEPARPINQTWGRVKNNFDNLEKIDAAYGDGHEVAIFSGDQIIVYQDSLENPSVTVKEGFPRRLRTHYQNRLPIDFVEGVDAAFKAEDGAVYLFKSGKYVKYVPPSSPSDKTPLEEESIRSKWGAVSNNIVETGQIDAAFVGLDGKTYLFSDDQYVRYSGDDYTQVDEGFPRTIDQDWGGLNTVDAAFVMDGKTYLFGKAKGSTSTVYVRYSTHDYSKQDEGYPKPPNDNWWNLPFSLVQENAPFENIDTVFNAPDNKTYLFSKDQFICFDHQQRWWSEPQKLEQHWDSIPFKSVNAAFTGKDGKTYLFSGDLYITYSSQDYSRTDDRYPNTTKRFWGHVANNIEKTGRIDAALVIKSHEVIDGKEQHTIHTYLFSGNQYFRYKDSEYNKVEEGYPKYIATSLKKEPRFKNLSATFEDGIDAAFADQRNIYLFKGNQYYVISETLYKTYDVSQANLIHCAFMGRGSVFVEEDTWYQSSSLEGKSIEKTAILPTLLRDVPTDFQTGLQAVLQGSDRNTYLFKDAICFNVSLNKSYPLSDEWGRIKNNIDIHNTIDAAFVGRDGKTYLFSGDQFVSYAANSVVVGSYVYDKTEQLPQPIATHWGGLTRIALAFVKDEKTYLFEPADDDGNARYVCYSTPDYSQPDAGFPQIGTSDFWQIPSAYAGDEFPKVNAVLFEGDNMFLLNGQRYIQFDSGDEQWTYPKPLARIWPKITFDRDFFKGVKTAFTGRDGATYFFSDEYYVKYEKDEFSKPTPIRERWGISRNNFTNRPPEARIDAAVVLQKSAYLFSGDQYIRYSGNNYRYVDEGYPKTIANNLRTEAGFQNLPVSFETTLAKLAEKKAARLIRSVLVGDRTLYILTENPSTETKPDETKPNQYAYQWHIASQSLTATYPINRLGQVKNNLVQQNKVDAALLLSKNGQTFLFSGDQGVRYSDDTYTYVDDGYPKAISTILKEELGISPLPKDFQYGIDAILKSLDEKEKGTNGQLKEGKLYLFKGKNYYSSDDTESKSISSFWGHIRNNFVNAALDTAFIAPDGKLYAFKGNQYIRYTNPQQEYVDEGFPKLIKDHWGNLPPSFEEAIAGAFVFDGRTYLLKGDDYVRYSNATYQLIDAIYPQKIKHRWGNWSDYLLSDLHIITRFKQLQDSCNGEYTLCDFLNREAGTVKDPYGMLAQIFNWDLDEIKWLKRKNAFLDVDDVFEVQFKLEIVIRLFDIFAIAQKLGSSPRELYDKVWKKRYSSDAKEVNLKDAADTLYRFLALIHGA